MSNKVKAKYFLLILLPISLNSCGNMPVQQFAYKISVYDKTVPANCQQRVNNGEYQNNAEGYNTCREQLLLAKAKELDFGNIPNLEAGLNENVNIGKKLDSHEITKDEYFDQIAEQNCKIEESWGEDYKKYTTDLHMMDVDKKIGTKCRERAARLK